MAFTYDVTTNRGKVRRLVSDIDTSDYLIEDAEVDFALDQASSDLNLAAAICCRMIATDFMKTAPKMNIAGTSFVVDRTRTPDYWMKMAEQFEMRANTKPYSDSQALTDDTVEHRDALKGKYEFELHDVPDDS